MKKMNLNPELKEERKSLFCCITTIDNSYLQAWVDAGAYVMYSGNQDYWIATNHVQLLFRIQEDSMLLECISTFVDSRKQGHGSEIMKMVTQFADETDTNISLQAANVTGNGYNIMQHPVIDAGRPRKNKIPVAALPKWYLKFGFTKSPSYTAKKKEMIYKPKTK